MKLDKYTDLGRALQLNTELLFTIRNGLTFHSFIHIHSFIIDKILYLQVPVGHPDEIDEIFDAISYSKGASVIRMLHDYIGDDVS